MNTDKIAILVKKAALEFDKIANPELANYDLTASQYKVLKFLYYQPQRTARVVDIERYYSMTHPTTIGLLDTLEAKGFITRVPNPDDARSRLILLTEQADEMQKELEKIGDSLEAMFTTSLSDAESKELAKLLRKLLNIDA